MSTKYLYILSVPLCMACTPDVGFKSDKGNSSGTKYSLETVTKDLKFNDKTDILFVLDESCSMETISQKVRDGVATLSSVNFAPNTNIAVTYMSPAHVFSNGRANYASPFYAGALHSPGYFQYVTQASVDHFLNMQTLPNRNNYLANQFTKKLCADAWFSPGQVNDDGQPCLEGAMQAPFMCTEAEAGLTYIKQFTEKLSAANEALFRDGANAHIVFVSDTHDAGNPNYYGGLNNPTAAPTFAALHKALLQNNPSVQSIRMSGVVPVPVVGDSRLTGLTVLGQIPQNASEAQVGSEGFYDYSYLSSIRSSGGVAIHANNNSWNTMMEELIEFTSSTSKVVVQLKNSSEKIESVQINGADVPASHYSYSSGAKALTVTHNFLDGVNYNIVVISKFKEI